jgi:hypothetical protein
MQFWWRLFKRTVLILLVFMATTSLVLYIFEDRIIKKVVSQVNTYLKVPVQVEQINLHFWRTFPHLSVAFDQVLIADPLSSKDTLLQAQQISLRFNPFDLWNGKYQIEEITSFNGQLNLKTDAKGQTNYDIFKDTSSSSSTFNLELETILLEQFKVAYRDQKSAQTYNTTIHTASISGKFSSQKTTLKAAGDVWINRIKKGQVMLLKNEPLVFDLALLVDQTQNLIKLPQAQIKIANLPFLIDAEFGPLQSSLDIRSQNLALVKLVRTLQPQSLAALKRVKAKGKVDFQLHYQSNAAQKAPEVRAYFSIKDGQLTEPQFGTQIQNLQCLGTYSNLPIDVLQIEKFSFTSSGARFAGQFQLKDFLFPKLAVSANGNIPLALVQALYPVSIVEQMQGVAIVRIQAQLAQDQQQHWKTQTLKGQVGIQAQHLQLTDFKKRFQGVVADIAFDEQDLRIDQFKATIGATDLAVQLRVPAYSAQFNSSKPLLISGRLIAKTLHFSDFETKSTSQKRTWILPQNLSLSLPCQTDHFTYEGKDFSQLSGTVSLSPNQLDISHLHFKHAKGSWNGQLKLKEYAPSMFDIETIGVAKKVALGELFKEWHNFDQTILTDEQLSGNGNFEFDVSTNYDLMKGLDEASLKARVHSIIDNGRLLHAPILQDLANTLTIGKGRAILGAKNQAALQQKLKDVRFEQLENTFNISERLLSFEKMHIASSALDLDLVGSHSFEHQIDYAVGLRLRDLLVQETQTEFGEILDDGTGLRLFVRISGSLEDPKVSWDKKGKKEAAQQQFERSQQESKEMLKATFGLYKDDPSVQKYQEKTTPHETIKVKFKTNENPVKAPTAPQAAPPKNGKLQQKLEKWKEEQGQASEAIKIKGKP